MANYSELLDQINDAIYENNNQEIDALEVRAILREMVTSLGSGFLFKGIATPSSPSGTGTYEPDQNVFYLATTAGTYTYLGGLVVAAGEVAFLCFDGTWTKKSSALLSTGSIVDNTTTEDATKPLSAKQGKVLADAGAATAAEVSALGQKVDVLNNEVGIITKPITFGNGWINTSGTIGTSSLSIFTQPILLHAGETVVVGTRNNNITILGSTTADSVAVGNTITPIQTTSGVDRFEEYRYTATADIKIVVCVRASEYILYFLGTNPESISVRLDGFDKEVEELTRLNNEVDNNGYPYNTIQGHLNGSGSIGDDSSNVVFTDYIPVVAGHRIWLSYQTADPNNNAVVYNAGKERLDYFSLYTTFGRMIEVPAGGAYLRFSAVATTAVSAYVYDITAGKLVWRAAKTIKQSVAYQQQELDELFAASARANELVIPFEKEGIPIYSTVTSVELAGNGLYGAASYYTANILKYKVTAGDILYLALSKDTRGVFQFQDNDTVPSSGTNTHLIGSPYNFAINGFIQVPIGAEYLFVSQFGSNTTNKVYKVITSRKEDAIFGRNAGRLPALYNACRWHKTSQNDKDWMAVICTDVHAWWLANSNAIKAANDFEMIDCYVNCGDICGSYYNTAQIESFQAALTGLAKPGYIVVGNHDVGNAYYIGYCCDHAQAYSAYIKPMVDAGWLTSGEYTAGKPYWYHDDATRKIRLIGLYEYDDALDLNETYWRAITYNSALSDIALSTAYSVGAQVNVPGYTAHSFEAVQAVTTPASYYTTPEMFPSYKVRRGQRVIRQEQAQWFLNTLATTPADYGVIVIMHNPFSDAAITQNLPFSWPANQQGASWGQNDMQTDFIRDALVAFKDGVEYSANIVMKGDAAYLNTQGGSTYAYSVSKDFSAKNAGVKLLGLLGGHSHRDFVWKDATEPIYQITPNCAIVDSANDINGDVRRTRTDGLCADSLTVTSFATGRIGLVKLGVNVTDRGTRRDYEVIDTTV